MRYKLSIRMSQYVLWLLHQLNISGTASGHHSKLQRRIQPQKGGGVGFPTPIHMSRLKCIDHKKRGIHPSPSPGSVNELCPLKWLYRKILVSKGLFICIHIYMYIHLSLTQICKPWANVIEIHVWQNKWYIELRSKVERYFSKDFEMTALHCTYFNWLFKLMKVNFLTEVTRKKWGHIPGCPHAHLKEIRHSSYITQILWSVENSDILVKEKMWF